MRWYEWFIGFGLGWMFYDAVRLTIKIIKLRKSKYKALEVDAARYRFLRAGNFGSNVCARNDRTDRRLLGVELDAAVDHEHDSLVKDSEYIYRAKS